MSILSRLPRPRTRSGKILTGLVSLFVAAGVGVALAALLTRAPISGGVSSGSFSPVWVNASADATGMTCVANTVNDGTLNLQITGALPGSSCTVTGTISLSQDATEGGKVTGVALTLPAGWNATLVSGCRADVNKLGPTSVSFKVTETAQAAQGGSSTFDPTTDGVLVQPDSDNTAVTCS